MNCSPNALIEAAKCYRCIPRPVMRSTIISLLCQWANAGGPVPPEPCVIHWTPEATVVDWVAGGIPANGDLATFLTVDPATVTDMDASARGLTEFSCPRYLPNLITLLINDNAIVGPVDISGCANLQLFRCDGNFTITALNVTGCNALLGLYCYTNQIGPTVVGLPLPNLTFFVGAINQLTSLNLGAAPMISIDCGQNLISTFNPNLYAATLQQFFMGANQLASCDASSCTLLSDIAVDGEFGVPAFTSLKISNSIFFVYVSAAGDALPATPDGVDVCLTTLEANCIGNMGTCNLDGGTNAPPTSPAAIAAKANLLGSGWTVNTN